MEDWRAVRHGDRRAIDPVDEGTISLKMDDEGKVEALPGELRREEGS